MADSPNPSQLMGTVCSATSKYDSPEWVDTGESSQPLSQPYGMELAEQAANVHGQQLSDKQLRDKFRAIANAVGISHLYFTERFSTLAQSTKRRRASAVKQTQKKLIELMAPDAPEELRQLVQLPLHNSFWTGQTTTKIFSLLESIAESYRAAETPLERRQILSIIAPHFSYSVIVNHIPGLSYYQFTRARLHAKAYGPGLKVPDVSRIRVKYDKVKVEAFISYITSFHVVFDMPFGEAKVKYSSGRTESIPNLCRIYINKHVIEQYKSYLEQNNLKNQLGMSDTTYWKILKYCPAKTRSSLHGLDYYTYAGSEGFDTLSAWVSKLGQLGMTDAWVFETQKLLKETKQYLKGDFKLHLKPQSMIPDHCLAYALSDKASNSGGVRFTQSCDHAHIQFCDHCEQMKRLLITIENAARDMKTFANEDDKNDALEEINKANTAIHEWRKHIVRTVYQTQVLQEILTTLQDHQVQCTCDYAMKFLVERGRETQSMWYGKKGLSWHICVCLKKTKNDTWVTRTYVHVFDIGQVRQTADEVSAILKHVLRQIKGELPQVTEVMIRTDNAGCYHSSAQIATAGDIKNMGIRIKRWSFSEAQSGKSSADRMAAAIKRNVRHYIAENHQVTNAKEFITAAASHTGVKAVSLYTGRITQGLQDSDDTVTEPPIKKRKKQKSVVGTASINGVSNLHEFFFSEGTIHAWKYYRIGYGIQIPDEFWKGKGFISEFEEDSSATRYEHMLGTTINQHSQSGMAWLWKQLKNRGQEEPENGVIDPVNPIEEIDNSYLETSDQDSRLRESHSKPLFECPEPNCIRKFQYYGNLLRHLDLGKHSYLPERLTLRDYAIGLYKEKIETMHVRHDVTEIEDAVNDVEQAGTDEVSGALPRSWALRDTKPSVRFNDNQINFLVGLFNQGAQSGKKFDPHVAEKQMKSAKNDDGSKQFDRSQYLSWQQIASFFSRYAAKQRREPIIGLKQQTNWNTNVMDDEYTRDPNFPTTEEHVLNEIEEQHDAIFTE